MALWPVVCAAAGCGWLPARAGAGEGDAAVKPAADVEVTEGGIGRVPAPGVSRSILGALAEQLPSYEDLKPKPTGDEAVLVAPVDAVLLEEMVVTETGPDLARLKATAGVEPPSALVARHLTTVDSRILNRWTLPFIGVTPDARAWAAELEFRERALLERVRKVEAAGRP